MIYRIFGTLAAVVLYLGLMGTGSATLLISGDGTETCQFAGGGGLGIGACALQAITAHPAWQANNPNGLGAVWKSYADTGSPGTVTAPNDGGTALIRVLETFTVAAGGANLLLDVWADDTAGVFIDNVLVFAPNFTQNICTNGAIGCQPGEQGMIAAFLGAGQHTIAIEVYQAGGGPFGLLYSGQVTNVPESVTLASFGLGLAGLGFMRRRQAT